jgi:transposase
MEPRVTQAAKAAIIQDWVRGERRDAIAAKHGRSAGTVTNTVQEWELGLGKADAAEVRELGVALKKLGITTPRCAEGARVVSLYTKL